MDSGIQADRIREFITANPGAIQEDIAEKFGCGVANVYKLARGLGIDTLVTRQQAAEQLPVEKPKYSLMHRAFNTPDPESVIEELGILLKEPGKIKRIRETYNQSGSPYGIADSLNK